MKNYLRDEYNKKVMELMAHGYVLSTNNEVARGLHSGEEMRVVLELHDGEYAAVIITNEIIWTSKEESLGPFVDRKYKVFIAKWSGVSNRSTLWLKDATEICDEAEFYSLGYGYPVVTKEEAIEMAKVKEERFKASCGSDVTDLTDNENAREIVLRHARKQTGTKRSKDEDIQTIRRIDGRRVRYQYIIRKANGKNETRDIYSKRY